jgi:Ca2+-binding RTX toxin-like protein
VVSLGTDIIDGGSGVDVLDFSAATTGVAYTVVQSGTDTTQNLVSLGLGVITYRNFEGAVGSNFNDTLSGSGSADSLDGGLGNDNLVGNGGNDTLLGGGGNDTLNGGSGNDVLFGGTGNDSLDGGSSNDSVTGGVGNDTINVGSGNDIVYYTSVLDGHDVIQSFDGNGGAGSQDLVDLDQLFDTLNVATNLRDDRTSIDDNGSTVDILIDADGNGSFELTIVTLQTSNSVTEGSDVVFGTL